MLTALGPTALVGPTAQPASQLVSLSGGEGSAWAAWAAVVAKAHRATLTMSVKLKGAQGGKEV